MYRAQQQWATRLGLISSYVVQCLYESCCTCILYSVLAVYNAVMATHSKRYTAHLHARVTGSGSVPGNLLRFDATIKLSSAANRTLFAQDAVKGIVMSETANRTSFQPIDISQLPYSAKSPVRALLYNGYRRTCTSGRFFNLLCRSPSQALYVNGTKNSLSESESRGSERAGWQNEAWAMRMTRFSTMRATADRCRAWFMTSEVCADHCAFGARALAVCRTGGRQCDAGQRAGVRPDQCASGGHAGHLRGRPPGMVRHNLWLKGLWFT